MPLANPTKRKRKFFLLSLLTVAVLLCATISFKSCLVAKNLLHPVRKPIVSLNSADTDFARVLEVSFATPDHLILRGWYLPSRNRAAVILVHGYGENRMQMLNDARLLARRGYGVLLFDLRGHGASDGKLVTFGDLERLDLKAALDYIANRSDVDRHRVGAIGVSMGGSVVMEVAESDKRIAVMVIEGADSSLEDEFRSDEFKKWGVLSTFPALWTFKHAGVNVDAIRPIDSLRLIQPRPIMFVNGTNDVVPQWMAKRLFRSAGEPKEYWSVIGARHAQYFQTAPDEYKKRVLGLLDHALVNRYSTTIAN